MGVDLDGPGRERAAFERPGTRTVDVGDARALLDRDDRAGEDRDPRARDPADRLERKLDLNASWDVHVRAAARESGCERRELLLARGNTRGTERVTNRVGVRGCGPADGVEYHALGGERRVDRQMHDVGVELHGEARAVADLADRRLDLVGDVVE